MSAAHGDARVATGEAVELVEDAGTASDGGGNGCTGNTEARKGSEAEDEAGAEQDVDRVGEPEDSHCDCRVAGAAEDGVDQKEQKNSRASAQHHTGVGRANCSYTM